VAALVVAASGACSGSSASDSSYCDAVRDHVGLSSAFDTNVAVDSTMSREEVESRLASAKTKLKRADDKAVQIISAMEKNAPDEVAPEVKRVVAYERRFLAAMRSVGYDLMSLVEGEGATKLRQSEAEQTASVRVDSDAQDRCDVGFTMAGGAVASTGGPPSTATNTAPGSSAGSTSSTAPAPGQYQPPPTVAPTPTSPTPTSPPESAPAYPES
jgi:hypothetical protein